jgi:hypothetical protein
LKTNAMFRSVSDMPPPSSVTGLSVAASRVPGAGMTAPAAFALDKIEATPDGGLVIATADAVIEIGGNLALAPLQILGWPGGRHECRVLPFWHPGSAKWIGPARLPHALGAAIAAEVLTQLNANGVHS